jgi:hypothetical protein
MAINRPMYFWRGEGEKYYSSCMLFGTNVLCKHQATIILEHEPEDSEHRKLP